jgi:hypothetical protein
MICPDLVAHDLSGLAPEGSHAAGGANGPDCLDRRRGRASARRAPLDRIAWVIEPYRTRSFDFTVKHFHEELEKQGLEYGYPWTKSVLQARGLVRRAPKRSAHRKKRARKPLPGMMLFQDGSTHAWLHLYRKPLRDRAIESRRYPRSKSLDLTHTGNT